jgi:nucleotidyltransferase substrate binding protein (TIGR01987 family)
MQKLEVKIKNFEKALSRLNEALQEMEENSFKPDVCIQRFEFTYEMCWKMLQSALRERGVIVPSPREVFDKAAKESFISDSPIWVNMRNDRNDSSHEYDEEKAMEIYKNIPAYAKEFEKVLNKMRV